MGINSQPILGSNTGSDDYLVYSDDEKTPYLSTVKERGERKRYLEREREMGIQNSCRSSSQQKGGRRRSGE